MSTVAKTRERKRKDQTSDTPPEAAKAVHPGAHLGSGNEVEQALKEATGIDFRIVEVDDLVFNDYNPNAMEQELFESLTDQVKEEGGVSQTLLVRPHPEQKGKWLVVDGEHRGKSAKIAGVKRLLAAVVPFVDSKAKLKTLSMNNLRGQAIPIRLAHLLVDLQKTYTQEEIARFTGIGMDKQIDVLKLLEVPDFSDMGDDTVEISADTVERPVQVSLLLMPDEKGSYDQAMTKAMGIAGADVTPLIGQEVKDYHEAIGEGMGIVGVKLRNVALATICRAFIDMPEEFKAKVAEKVREKLKVAKAKVAKKADPLQ